MGKLHEVLAVISDTDVVAADVTAEAIQTFKKPERLTGMSKTLKMVDSSREHEEAAGAEERVVVTTVQRKLDYVAGHLIRNIDAILQKETTNTEAKADVILEDGTILLERVPATGLLALENKIPKWRAMYENIPTLQPGIDWLEDEDQVTGVYVATPDEVRNKTEKVTEPVVLYKHTPEHPAQVKEVSKDIVVGHFTTRRWSGMITPARKSELLGRLDELLRAVKKARMRANEQEVIDVQVGKTIFDFVHKED